mgnify:CR=1 FL=1
MKPSFMLLEIKENDLILKLYELEEKLKCTQKEKFNF